MSQPQYFTNKIMIFIVVPSLKSQNPRKDQLMLQNQLLILLTQTKMFPRFPRMILCFDGFYYICKDFFILLFLFLKDSLYKMEKYIFDCRQKLYDSPKYLKRNQNISQISHQHHQIQTKAPLPYLKNKVFITFDYSYYRIIPKTASLHINSRVNNSLCSLVNQNQFQGNQCRQSITSFTVGDSKWKKEKENVQISPNLQLKKSCSQKNNGKKIKKPINCMPGVGDYEFQTKTIEKKIVYDVKIRGKPQQSILFRQSQECPDKFGDLNNNKMSQIVKNEKQYKTSKRIGRHRDYNANSLIKDRRMKAKMRQNQEQYFKFINPIDSTNVWNKLMQKYKLKGTKFDTHGFNQ